MTDPHAQAQTLAGAIDRIDIMLATEPAQAGDALESVDDWGSYDGLPPKVILLPDGRNGTLIDPIAYHQASGDDWPVPAGASLDGASIPRAFWTLIGGPFEGQYRDASIVHDHYCVTKDRPWPSVHRMFYEAMRCSGVGRSKAGVMYYAVYRFGPKWPDPSGDSVESAFEERAPAAADAAGVEQDARAIVEHDLGPEAIERLARKREAMRDEQ